MDELTLVAEFRSNTPGPTTAETAAARDALLAATDEVRRGPGPRTASYRAAAARRAARRLWVPVAAGTCAAAVAIAAAIVMSSSPRARAPEHRPAVLTAAFVLRQAASAAAAQAAGHGRFFVSESEYVDPGNRRDAPRMRVIWIGNGVTGRLVDHGWGASSTPIPPGISFGRGIITWAQLMSLPTAPGPLLAEIAAASRNDGQPPVQAEFGTIVGLLFESPTNPALRSALYLAASRLPGVTLVPAAHDLIGRAAAEVYMPPGFPGNGGEVLFFDPSTSAVLGTATLVGSTVQCPPAWEAAVLAAGYVNSKYQLPPGASRSLKPVSWPRSAAGCPPPTSGQPAVSPAPGQPAVSPSPGRSGVTPSATPSP
jgi:hypothetical protein